MAAARRILLIDDELPLLQLIERHLKRIGYEVDTHALSASGLESLEAKPDGYGLVIADLGMPDISGEALVHRIFEIHPGARILICSGTPFYVSSLPAPLAARVAFLQKPFLPKMLADEIEKLLARDLPSQDG